MFYIGELAYKLINLISIIIVTFYFFLSRTLCEFLIFFYSCFIYKKSVKNHNFYPKVLIHKLSKDCGHYTISNLLRVSHFYTRYILVGWGIGEGEWVVQDSNHDTVHRRQIIFFWSIGQIILSLGLEPQRLLLTGYVIEFLFLYWALGPLPHLKAIHQAFKSSTTRKGQINW